MASLSDDGVEANPQCVWGLWHSPYIYRGFGRRNGYILDIDPLLHPDLLQPDTLLGSSTLTFYRFKGSTSIDNSSDSSETQHGCKDESHVIDPVMYWHGCNFGDRYGFWCVLLIRSLHSQHREQK